MKYEKVAVCPKRIKNIIDLVNLLPDNAKSINEDIFNFVRDYESGYSLEEKPFVDYVKPLIKNNQIIDYLFEGMKIRVSPITVFKRFNGLLQAKEVFNQAFRTYKTSLNLAKYEDLAKKSDYYIQKVFTNNLNDLYFNISLRLDDKGCIKPGFSDFLEILAQEDIPLIRIRLCEICSKVYWAKKTNAETCGRKECASTLYNRNRLKKIKQAKEDKKTTEEKKRIERINRNNLDYNAKEN